MHRYLPEPQRGLFPAQTSRKLAKTFDQMDAQAAVAVRSDELRIARVVQTAEEGMDGIMRLSSREAICGQVVPHARGRLGAVADEATVSILYVVHRAGR
jgi:hypothetical protein